MTWTEIPPPILAAFVSVCGTLVGVVLGFTLSSRREHKAKEEKRQSIREMLRTEMQLNLDQLEGWSSGPLPVQSNQIWQSQLEAVPSALNPEEVKRVHAFYYRLYGLRKLAESELAANVQKFVADGNPLPASNR